MRRTLLLPASMALAVVLVCGVAIVEAVRPAQAVFPGTNGRIVFWERDDDSRDSGIKLINQAGSSLTTLVDSNRFPHGAVSPDPAMSPSGTKVAYARGAAFSNSVEIYRINATNRKITRITNNELYDSNPTWSPDGTRIAFVRGEYVLVDGRMQLDNVDIVVRRADRTGTVVNLTNTPNEDEFAPAWSPDGTEIAFHEGEFGSDIFVLDLETGQRRNLTNDGTAHRDTYPSWSPDGTRIVFESAGSEDIPDFYDFERIYTTNASDGSDRRLLAEVREESGIVGRTFSGTTYSPNGRKIAYVVGQYDCCSLAAGRLYTMDASNGANKRRIYISDNSGEMSGVSGLSFPDWGDKARN